MNKKTLSITLMTVGIVILAYAGISFTTPGKPIDVFGIHIETTTRHYVPPVAGAFALVGGMLLFFLKPKNI